MKILLILNNLDKNSFSSGTSSATFGWWHPIYSFVKKHGFKMFFHFLTSRLIKKLYSWQFKASNSAKFRQLRKCLTRSDKEGMFCFVLLVWRGGKKEAFIRDWWLGTRSINITRYWRVITKPGKWLSYLQGRYEGSPSLLSLPLS